MSNTKPPESPNQNQMMIALYYWYINIPSQSLKGEITFHESLCQKLRLFGRIRISSEGLNGVLSGTVQDLKEYEDLIRKEIEGKFRLNSGDDNDDNDDNTSEGEGDGEGEGEGDGRPQTGPESTSTSTLQYGQTLDMKYCHLREDIPVEKQLFDSINVKVTKEVVSLNQSGGIDETQFQQQQQQQQKQNKNKNKKKNKKKNKGDRYQQIMEEDRKKKQEQVQLQLQQLKLQQQQEEQNEAQNKTQQDSHEQSTVGKEIMVNLNLDNIEPATHLSPKEWNEHLLSYNKNNNSSSIFQQQQQQQQEKEQLPSLSQTQTPDDTKNKNNTGGAILIDARNIYESKIGYFTSQNVPTLLTNTRKYSTITSVLNESIHHMAGKNVYMYCTGGVRCERASVYLQALANSDSWPVDVERPKSIYQLEGGIQKYLERYGTLEGEVPVVVVDKSSSDHIHSSSGDATTADVAVTAAAVTDAGDVTAAATVGDNNDNSQEKKEVPETEAEGRKQNNQKETCLFRGKNFVFDPRRYDPVIGVGVGVGMNDTNTNNNMDQQPVVSVVSVVGKCIICSIPFDDYDNNHAPCENMEARCCRCRVLVLVCNDCRLKVRVWGQEVSKKKNNNNYNNNTHLTDANVDIGTTNTNTNTNQIEDEPSMVEEECCCPPDVFCGPQGKECIDEGNCVDHYEVINNNS